MNLKEPCKCNFIILFSVLDESAPEPVGIYCGQKEVRSPSEVSIPSEGMGRGGNLRKIPALSRRFESPKDKVVVGSGLARFLLAIRNLLDFSNMLY